MTSPAAALADPWPAPVATAPVDAVVSLPGSKSLTNRALVLAALADGPSVVRRALRSRDTLLMAQALTALGAPVDTSGDDWAVTPLDPSAGADRGRGRLRPGRHGDAVRAAGVPAWSTARSRSTATRTCATGRSARCSTALTALGVVIDDGGRGSLPFMVTGEGRVPGGTVVIDASASSQFVSALLLAGARYEHGVDVRHDGKPVPSLPHIEMTVAMLRDRGVAVDDSDANRWAVAPGPIAAHDEAIEPDLSNAAPFLALAAGTGGSVIVRDWPESTTQPGDALRDLLARMGCTVDGSDAGLRVTGPAGGHRGLLGIDADLHDVGELAPAIAALCALASTPSHLRGIAHIRGHETDRLAALAKELGALGADVTEHPDGLSLRPAPLTGGVFHTYADHRMAHAGVIIGAAVPGILVEDVATTSKTFPDFAGFWASLFIGRAL